MKENLQHFRDRPCSEAALGLVSFNPRIFSVFSTLFRVAFYSIASFICRIDYTREIRVWLSFVVAMHSNTRKSRVDNGCSSAHLCVNNIGSHRSELGRCQYIILLKEKYDSLIGSA